MGLPTVSPSPWQDIWVETPTLSSCARLEPSSIPGQAPEKGCAVGWEQSCHLDICPHPAHRPLWILELQEPSQL